MAKAKKEASVKVPCSQCKFHNTGTWYGPFCDNSQLETYRQRTKSWQGCEFGEARPGPLVQDIQKSTTIRVAGDVDEDGLYDTD